MKHDYYRTSKLTLTQAYNFKSLYKNLFGIGCGLKEIGNSDTWECICCADTDEEKKECVRIEKQVTV